VLKDDFSTNKNNWSAYYFNSKVEVKDGKLFLESYDSGSAVALTFYKPSPHQYFTGNYYLQADLTTEQGRTPEYGLVFSVADGNYYQFIIAPFIQKYSLRKTVDAKWTDLKQGYSTIIKSSTEVNTLGVYFDRGNIEAFINGQQVMTYQDKDPLTQGRLGLYIDNAGFKLIVDNFFAYNDN
jgi:hypothetical protein